MQKTRSAYATPYEFLRRRLDRSGHPLAALIQDPVVAWAGQRCSEETRKAIWDQENQAEKDWNRRSAWGLTFAICGGLGGWATAAGAPQVFASLAALTASLTAPMAGVAVLAVASLAAALSTIGWAITRSARNRRDPSTGEIQAEQQFQEILAERAAILGTDLRRPENPNHLSAWMAQAFGKDLERTRDNRDALGRMIARIQIGAAKAARTPGPRSEPHLGRDFAQSLEGFARSATEDETPGQGHAEGFRGNEGRGG